MRSQSYLSKLSKLGRGVFLGGFMVFFLVVCSGVPTAFAAAVNQGLPSFADLADEVKHAIVNISTTQVVKEGQENPLLGPDSPFREFFGDEFYKKFFDDIPRGEMKTHALGSGFVIDKNGLILTNNHVIEKADEIKVKLENDKEYDAEVVGRDPKTDLALIRVKPDADFPKPVTLGDSNGIRVGDWVMAVGNPFGLGHTVTVGIISAKGRVIGAGPYDDFLQTDAAINPGNSGGPLYNTAGEVVGINTAIVAQGQGIGFAIPINMAKELLPQLETGKIVRGWLGIMIQDVTPELAQSFGLSNTKGVLIADIVKEGPAEKAGLKQGDVVIRFQDKEVGDAHELSRMVAAVPSDTQVEVAVIRDGKPETIKVIVGTMPEEEQVVTPAKTESPWGITVQGLTPEMAQRFGLEEGDQGVIVSNVEFGSPAGEAGLQSGDLIKEVNRQKIQSVEDYENAVGKSKSGESLLLLIKRDERTFYVVLKPASKE